MAALQIAADTRSGVLSFLADCDADYQQDDGCGCALFLFYQRIFVLPKLYAERLSKEVAHENTQPAGALFAMEHYICTFVVCGGSLVPGICQRPFLL